MNRESLLTPEALREQLAEGRSLVFDCRFDLKDTEAGRNAWLAAHIPGARYAHLDEDLSSPITPDSGRHPLPAAASFARFLARSGWRPGTRVVAYDSDGGQYAARLWWLMRYFGHDEAALLDGGMAAWHAAGLPLETGLPEFTASEAVELDARPERVITTAELESALAGDGLCLLDARAGERFRGEIEPLDTVAGHIPGALNHPCTLNLDNNRLRPEAELRRAFRQVCGGDTNRPVIHMCGSGVTACLNLFAMERAGYANQRLYAGSWSEWIRDPSRPVVVGD